MATKKYVYFFGGGKAEGNKDMRSLLGGKGCGIAEMTNIGVSVPPGFTITTEACIFYSENNKKWPDGLEEQVKVNLDRLEKLLNKKLGDSQNPLLVSVRSGAAISMPGMMDTVLNLGLNDETVKGLIEQTGNERFGYDSYRRFIQMFGDIVLNVDKNKFEKALEDLKEKKGAKLDVDLTADDLKELVDIFKSIIEQEGKILPQNAYEQLKATINAVFESWNNPRAIEYRRIYNIPNDLGTAVNVQAMVFGNISDDSGTGVAFTRNPSTGERVFYGEYLLKAQGEDVVAGIRTPQPISSMEKELPDCYAQLLDIAEKLERHYREMQDIEFTIERGKLYMLQTRTGKRTAAAAVKIAVDMANEGIITKEEAVKRVDPDQLNQLLHPQIDPNADVEVIAKGLPASPGAAVGKIVFTADEASRRGQDGEKVILVRSETCPDDIHGMVAAQGILTARGGMTSHAAVVARGMGKCCIVGCEALKIDETSKVIRVNGRELKEGDFITLDGTTGRVIKGQAPTIEAKMTGEIHTLLEWADQIRTLKIRTNADTPKDAKLAREFGAEGIGLCRTEHMFFEADRLPIMQEMILANTKEEREEALAKLLPMQKEDFKGIFEAMEGLPVTIRLLDPPLHEFLPNKEALMEEIEQLRVSGKDPKRLQRLEETLKKVESLAEANPMLGFRGCRLGIIYPEISRMQAKAIFEAACELTKEGKKVIPEIMVPLVGHVKELKLQRKEIEEVAKEVVKKYGINVEYQIGTMIELPRAAITADEIAQEADFFSFGTNDLTQTTFGFSRDDAEGKFLHKYVEDGILEYDPFQVLDTSGVGELVRIGVEKGRKTKNELKIGICGEHGGDPKSIAFCHKTGLNYVSCSPFRVPIARLAAAQACLSQ